LVSRPPQDGRPDTEEPKAGASRLVRSMNVMLRFDRHVAVLFFFRA
jgi:hypothetical protein